MPLCDCGCGQTLDRQNIKKHHARKVVPRLVSSAVQAFLTHGAVVSPLRLLRSRKLRTSRPYFPSHTSVPLPSESFNSDAEMDFMEGGYTEDSPGTADFEVVEFLRHVERDVWDGRHYHRDEEDDGDCGFDDVTEDFASDDDENTKGYDHWEAEHGDTESPVLDLLNEEFKQEAIARGMFYAI